MKKMLEKKKKKKDFPMREKTLKKNIAKLKTQLREKNA